MGFLPTTSHTRDDETRRIDGSVHDKYQVLHVCEAMTDTESCCHMQVRSVLLSCQSVCYDYVYNQQHITTSRPTTLCTVGHTQTDLRRPLPLGTCLQAPFKSMAQARYSTGSRCMSALSSANARTSSYTITSALQLTLQLFTTTNHTQPKARQ